MVELHPEDRVAGLDQRVVRGGVRLGARVRLHVGVIGAEQLLGTVDRQLLGHVDVLAAACELKGPASMPAPPSSRVPTLPADELLSLPESSVPPPSGLRQ